MVDPTSVIGTVAAVLQLAQSACKAALELYNFCSVVQNAPQEIISISQNAQAFYMVISDLERALRSGTVATVVSGDVEITTTLETLKIPIENCSLACEVPMEKLIPHLPVDSSSQAVVTTDTSGGTSQIQRRRFSRGNVMWFFKRKQILALEADLKRTNTALGTSLSSAILFVSVWPSCVAENVLICP
ncbi:hypothetical protein BDV41DRAFT_568783 [Aspergillus transmontanensis]|uniref:Fungal N-terminal domain-containing protein n=1 Tax=Aspergillus transmontanensis TaxID=1034304 RepID=A0A5N6VI15_9EURO|nr:hypothetical protein BDV41DRAFT_568783 [Aspergillus transmontanensis]